MEGEIFGALCTMVFEGVGVAGGEEDEIPVACRVELSVDILLDMAGAHEDDLFGAVGVWWMADFAGVEGSGVEVDL